MKKIFSVFCLLVFGHGIVSYGNIPDSTLPENAAKIRISEILKQIFEKNPDVNTFSASFQYVEKNASISDEEKYILKWKKSINSFLYVYNYVPEGKEKDEKYNYVSSFLYCNNARITTFEIFDKKIKGRTWKFVGDNSSAFVYLGSPHAMFAISPFIGRTAVLNHKLSSYIKMNSQKTHFEFVDYNGEKCFQIRVITKGESSNEYHEKFEFLFELKSALLSKKSLHIKSKGIDILTEYYFENYIKTNNIFFPTKMTERTYRNKEDMGAVTTYINKESLRINEPIPDEVFIPTIPEGMIVDDRIQKRKYVATGISSTQKEKLITAELDRIFNESEK